MFIEVGDTKNNTFDIEMGLSDKVFCRLDNGQT